MSEVLDGCSSLNSAWIEGHGSRVPLENILIMAAPSNKDYYQDYHEDNHKGYCAWSSWRCS